MKERFFFYQNICGKRLKKKRFVWGLDYCVHYLSETCVVQSLECEIGVGIY